MRGAELAELAVFLAVAKNRSFRKTATERGVASSAISHAMRTLEARLGIRLLNRTTRSVSLTEAGERFLSDLAPAFEQIAKAQDGLNEFRGSAFGTVRINLPTSLAPIVLGDLLAPLISDHPGLRLDVVASDGLDDIVAEGFDAGIRLGERLSQDMIAVRIKPKLQFAVVGSPRYLCDRPRPKHPRDLAGHACIRYRFPSGRIFDWEFERRREAFVVAVEGPLTLDSQEMMVEAPLNGCGLAYIWRERATSYLASGELVACLTDWCPELDDLFIYYASRRHVSAGLRVLIDRLKA